jgi:phage-related protein
MYEYYDSVSDAEAQAQETEIVNRALTKLPEPYLSGLKLRADIKIGPLVLNTIDSDGVVWICTDIEGWWNLPDPEFPDLIRGWGDGSYDAVGRYAARILTLSGVFMTQDPSQVEVARAKLIDAVNLVYRGDWLVVNESTPKASFVRLSGQPEINNTRARGRTEFSVQLKAADPIKYEWIEGSQDNYRTTTINSGSSATIVNAGNIKVPMFFELNGPITASVSSPVKITNTTPNPSTEIQIIKSLTAPQILEIDTYNREALLVEGASTLSGRDKLEPLIDWIYLEPGNNVISFSGATGKSVKVYHRSGWIG